MMEKEAGRKTSEKPKKARITLECSPEERKTIRIRAAQEDKSMNHYILSRVLETSEKKEEKGNIL